MMSITSVDSHLLLTRELHHDRHTTRMAQLEELRSRPTRSTFALWRARIGHVLGVKQPLPTTC